MFTQADHDGDNPESGRPGSYLLQHHSAEQHNLIDVHGVS
jgi:hypothetical protein